MTYKETIEYLYNAAPMFQNIGAGAYKEGLYNTLALDEHMGHPHRAYKTIHVAGTNGKGSVSHTLAAILQQAGYRVGLYTSPHLVDFRERIRVNGKMISKERVVKFVEEERAFFEPLHPSFFELTTAIAFKYFQEQQVDVALIEVGMGGRLDCTNIIAPILSIITNISKDHTQFLGKSFTDIAREKAGIIKRGVPVVIGETNGRWKVKKLFIEKAMQMESPITLADEKGLVQKSEETARGTRTYQTSEWGTIESELGGYYQIKNTATILMSVKELIEMGFNISNSHINEGFRHVTSLTGLKGRWQVIRRHPLIVCDTGHNPGGFQYLVKQISAQRCDKLHIVFGMVADKDVRSVINSLPMHAEYYFTQSSVKRSMPAEQLASIAGKSGLKGKTFHDVASAFEAARTNAGPSDFIFVGGSSYVVADLLKLVK